MDKKETVKKIFDLLLKKFPNPKIILLFSNPLELLIATVLAAQCTDVRVNSVTKDLFIKYPNVKSFAEADISTLEEDIRSTGFYKNKAKSIKGLARDIIELYGGNVPSNIDLLVKLPGVGRKTANVVLNECFGKSEIVVDTHFKRVGMRLGLTSNTNPEKIEKDFIEITSPDKRGLLSHLFTYHGRFICHARKPDCQNCPVSNYCAYFSK